mmetsp:Transcript_25195/g.46395  ORF Transcript_25195/g.46395 Transcript_25195/m.46395 type:complete len:444 (-) Transcript_25195:190-1521(-)
MYEGILQFHSQTMDNFNHAADANNKSCSDDDDLRLFESCCGPELVRKILRIKHNDPEVTRLTGFKDDLNEVASRRLGHILGQNTHLEELSIWDWNLDMVGLCAGLQNNRCIMELDIDGIDLRDAEKMSSLAPFLSNNPSLRDIILSKCNIGPDSISILSNALSYSDTLELLHLGNNRFGDVDLHELVRALKRSRKLLWLDFPGCEIGQRGCTSLARLLENHESNLETLNLGDNSIDDDSAIILVDSLVKNTKLKSLHLDGNNGINTSGWSAMLDLVCKRSSINDVMESNHTLYNLGYSSADLMKAVDRTLEVDNANLLRASLEMNETTDKMLVARSKVLWNHARGDLNLGESFIATGTMHRILVWIGDDSNQTNANLIQYHHPRLPKARIDTIRLDSIYRIIRSRPSLCNSEQNMSNDLETCQKLGTTDYRTQVKRKADKMQT